MLACVILCRGNNDFIICRLLSTALSDDFAFILIICLFITKQHLMQRNLIKVAVDVLI